MGSEMCIRDSSSVTEMKLLLDSGNGFVESATVSSGKALSYDYLVCLLYTSDAADERSSVDLGGRRLIKKKKNAKNTRIGNVYDK